MPRYYFDLVDDQTVFDHEGISLPNVDEARKFATTFARELADTKPDLMGESVMAWSVQVNNAQFEPVLTVPLAAEMGRKAAIGPQTPQTDTGSSEC
jgi:hypothetical protein